MPTTEWRLKAERDCQGGGPVQWIMFQVDGVDVDDGGSLMSANVELKL